MPTELTLESLLYGYSMGIFPMADDDDEIHWYSPDPRCVIDLDGFRVSRSLRSTVRRGEFDIRINTAFDEVIRACADREEGTWISPEIVAVYTALHREGFAHSVECWLDGRLAGGLYGVTLGGAFFGESMFHRVTDASKVALVALVERMRARLFTLLDVQWITSHLARFGAVEIPRMEYLRRLDQALTRECRFAD